MTAFGIGLPQDAVRSDQEGDRLRRIVESTEAAGLHSVWVAEGTGPDLLDPLAVLHHAAALSRSVRLGTAVLLPAFRTPLRLAREIGTLDRLSAGRAIIGVGLGNGRDEYRQQHLSVPHRGDHFEQGIRVLRSLLRQERTTSHEPWWSYDQVPRPLAPVQQPMPPLWFGARSPEALERAVRLGDGWIGAGSATAAEFATALDTVRRLLSEAGRPPGTFTIANRVYLHVIEPGHNVASVRERLHGWFAGHYANPLLADDVVVVGPPQACAEHLQKLSESGVDLVILHPVLDPTLQLEALVDRVIPLVD